MSIEDFSIIYNYFEPSQQERQTVHSIISNIYYSGPSDAVVKAMITRHHGRYLCQLRVASSAMIEVVNFESDKLLRAVIGARRIMNLKIHDWKIKPERLATGLIFYFSVYNLICALGSQKFEGALLLFK